MCNLLLQTMGIHQRYSNFRQTAFHLSFDPSQPDLLVSTVAIVHQECWPELKAMIALFVIHFNSAYDVFTLNGVCIR